MENAQPVIPVKITSFGIVAKVIGPDYFPDLIRKF
jgi:hypothetical protein